MSKKLFMDEREAELASQSENELDNLNQLEYTKHGNCTTSKNKRLQGSKKPGSGRKGK
jgi:hypothetical protein